VVFLVSSVLITVPSDFSVTVFSFDLTVPSLLTLLLSVLETVRSHPTNKDEKAMTDAAANIAILRFMRSNVGVGLNIGYGAYPAAKGGGRSYSLS
jgi:hypothetical protein